MLLLNDFSIRWKSLSNETSFIWEKVNAVFELWKNYNFFTAKQKMDEIAAIFLSSIFICCNICFLKYCNFNFSSLDYIKCMCCCACHQYGYLESNLLAHTYFVEEYHYCMRCNIKYREICNWFCSTIPCFTVTSLF